MDIFGLIEAYKFLQKFQKSKYVMDYILDGERVLYVNSLAWDDEMFEKYKPKIKALGKQKNKEMDKITKGCGSYEFIFAAIEWGVYHSSHREEAISMTRWIFLPMVRFDQLLLGKFDYKGTFCTDEELNQGNKLLDEFITKFESECNESRRGSLMSWVFTYLIFLFVLMAILPIILSFTG